MIMPRGVREAGQSMVEAIVAVAVFSAISFVALTFSISNYEAAGAGKRLTYVQAYATEAMEAARAIRDRGWQNLSLGQHGIATSSGYWDFSGSEDTLESGEIARSVVVSTVNRDGNGDITLSGGTLDPKTRFVMAYVTSTLSGAPTVVYSIAMYLTNWLLTEVLHTTDSDWSGGTHSNTQVNGTGDTASIGESWVVAGKQWIPGAGRTFTHTSVADFSAGTLTDTVVSGGGDGTPGEVGLAVSGASDWSVIDTPDIGEHLNALSMYSSADGFGVGNGGSIVRWNGTYWDIFDSPTTENLNGVAMTSVTDGWAVGDDGEILRWDGADWSGFLSPTNDDLFGISMVSEADGFAVGEDGTVIRWNGTAWSVVPEPSGEDLYGVHMLSDVFGFAVGNGGTIVRWNGTSWSEVSSPTPKDLNGVYLTSTTYGFAVGDNGRVLRWDGSIWTQLSGIPLNDNMRNVFLLSPTFGYIVGGNGALMEWDGSSWSDIDSGTTHQLNSVYFVDENNGWVLGNNGTRLWYGPAYEQTGTLTSAVFDSGATTSTWNSVYWSEVLQFGTDVTVAVRTGNTATPGGGWTAWSAEYSNPDGNTLSVAAGRYFQYRVTLTTDVGYLTPYLEDVTVVYNNPASSQLNGVSMASTADGFAVGASGQIVRYDGSVWNALSSPTSNALYGVSMASSTFGMAVGNGGTTIRWDGSSWSTVASGVTNNLRAVHALSSTDAWAVGASGRILRWNGSSWSVQTSGTSRLLYGVSMVSPTFGIAVGAQGTIRRWDGSSWSASSSGTNDDFYGVSMLSSTDGFAVGENGEIRRWNGSSWSSVASPTGEDLRAVVCHSPTLAYAVGTDGALIVWDGTSWSADVTMTSNDLFGIDLVTDSEGWVAGAGGFLGHLTGTSGYMSSASYISPAIDSGFASTTWDSVSWNATTSTATNATVATRTGEVAVPDATWSAFSTELADPYGSTVLSPAGRYLQYRVTLTTTDPASTAAFDDITVSY